MIDPFGAKFLYGSPTPNSLQACPQYTYRIQNMHFVYG